MLGLVVQTVQDRLNCCNKVGRCRSSGNECCRQGEEAQAGASGSYSPSAVRWPCTLAQKPCQLLHLSSPRCRLTLAGVATGLNVLQLGRKTE